MSQYETAVCWHPKNRDGMNSLFVIKCLHCVVEKTVRRAGRAWYISQEEM